MDRGILEKDIWLDQVAFRLFFYLIVKASFKDNLRVGSVNLTRGQWLRSYRNLQEDLEYIENRSVRRYSLDTIKRAVDRLVEAQRIKIQTTELGTLFTLVNYSQYQGITRYQNPASRTDNEQQANIYGTSAEHLPNNKKEINNNALTMHNQDLSDAGASDCASPKKQKKGEVSKEARAVVNKLSDAIKRHGAKEGQFSTQWAFAGFRVADRLLKSFSVEELGQATDFLVDHPFQGAWIRSMADVEKNLPLWQRRHEEQKQHSVAPQIVPSEARKGGVVEWD